MKRVLIFLVLSISLIIVWPVYGKSKQQNAEPFNYGQVWNSRTDLTRDAWLKGFSDGVWRTCEIVLDTKLGLPVFDEIRDKINFPFNKLKILVLLSFAWVIPHIVVSKDALLYGEAWAYRSSPPQ